MRAMFRAFAQFIGIAPYAIQSTNAGRSSASQGNAEVQQRPDGRDVRHCLWPAISQVFVGRGSPRHESARSDLRDDATPDVERAREGHRATIRPVPRARRHHRAGFGWGIAGIVLSLFSFSALADTSIRFETGIGGSGYVRGGDGYWIQDGFQHHLQLTAPAVEAGLTGDLIQRDSWGLSWHADYVWLGTVHTQGLATPSDENYNLKTKSCNGPCWPMANYVGTGHDSGFILTLEPHYDSNGWRYAVEYGPYIYRSTWTEHVYHWVSTPTATPQDITVENQARWKIGSVVGTSVSHGNFTLAYQYFFNETHVTSGNQYPPIWRGTHALMLKYKF